MVPCVLKSPKGKQYVLVVVDDFSRFTWLAFLREKLEAMIEFSKLYKELPATKNLPIAIVMKDHVREVNQLGIDSFCAKYVISLNFSTLRMSQQNKIVERKNRTFEDISWTMHLESSLPKLVNNANYILNRCLIRPLLKKTPYEFSRG